MGRFGGVFGMVHTSSSLTSSSIQLSVSGIVVHESNQRDLTKSTCENRPGFVRD
jgi:hypothetical protein